MLQNKLKLFDSTRTPSGQLRQVTNEWRQLGQADPAVLPNTTRPPPLPAIVRKTVRAEGDDHESGSESCGMLRVGYRARRRTRRTACGRVAADHSRSGRERSRPTQRAGFCAKLRPR